MLIEIHMIQNHSPNNLNRDDLGAPKTCYFGGVLRQRISSQCLKRSIRTSEQFEKLCGGIRTRRLAKCISKLMANNDEMLPDITKMLTACGLNPGAKSKTEEKQDSDSVVYVSHEALVKFVVKLKEQSEVMRKLEAGGLTNSDKASKKSAKAIQEGLERELAKLIATESFDPDMALSGRMLQPKKDQTGNKGKKKKPAMPDGGEDSSSKVMLDSEVETDELAVVDADEAKLSKVKFNAEAWKDLNTTVDAALQVAHAISTHIALPQTDYYVAADDIPGPDAGAAFVGEGLFASACFYKYFSIDWDQLVKNLNGNERLAAHTVGAFLRGAVLTTPTGKQNSYASHTPPDAILVEIKKTSEDKTGATFPVSYANAFARPVPLDSERGLIEESIARLSTYANDLDKGYGKAKGHTRLAFSLNGQHEFIAVARKPADPSTTAEGADASSKSKNPKIESVSIADQSYGAFDDLINAVVKEIGYDWADVQSAVVPAKLADLLKKLTSKTEQSLTPSATEAT